MEQSRTGNQQDINARIIGLMKIRGPILPVHAAKETNLSLLLTGAFLSSLASEKLIKISNMKVGGSPLYFLSGQEPLLENFNKFLNHKEREAYFLLKERKVLQDDKLTPDIRVAIRNIKDFASSFSLNQNPGVLYWKFFTLNDEEIEKEMQKYKMITEIPKPIEQPKPEIKVEEKQIEPIFPSKQEAVTEKKRMKRKARIKTDKFLEEIKPLLAGKNLELVKIEKYDSKEVNLIAKQNEKEIFVLALNKKRIEEADLLKAFRKASILKLPYLILGKGEMPKKLKEIMEASKGLDRIEKI